MSVYTCPRCGLVLKSKNNLLGHLRRVNPCEPLLQDISSAEALQMFKVRTRNHGDYECEMCLSRFASEFSLTRHQGKCFRRKKVFQDTAVMQFKMLTKVQQLEAQIKELTGNPATINITNNFNQTIHDNRSININYVGRESMGHILSNKNFLDQCLIRTDKGLIELIQRIHCDPEHPENMNVFVPNKRERFVKEYDRTGWISRQKERVLRPVVYNGKDIMVDHMEEHGHSLKSKISERRIQHIKNWLEKLEDDENNEKLLEPILQEVFMLFADHRKLILDTLTSMGMITPT